MRVWCSGELGLGRLFAGQWLLVFFQGRGGGKLVQARPNLSGQDQLVYGQCSEGRYLNKNASVCVVLIVLPKRFEGQELYTMAFSGEIKTEGLIYGDHFAVTLFLYKEHFPDDGGLAVAGTRQFAINLKGRWPSATSLTDVSFTTMTPVNTPVAGGNLLRSALQVALLTARPFRVPLRVLQQNQVWQAKRSAGIIHLVLVLPDRFDFTFGDLFKSDVGVVLTVGFPKVIASLQCTIGPEWPPYYDGTERQMDFVVEDYLQYHKPAVPEWGFQNHHVNVRPDDPWLKLNAERCNSPLLATCGAFLGFVYTRRFFMNVVHVKCDRWLEAYMHLVPLLEKLFCPRRIVLCPLKTEPMVPDTCGIHHSA